MSEERAIFAGGCFWCMVEPFESRTGILSVTSGFTGGHIDDPTYDQVCGQYSGHVEAVEILYDSALMSYETLVSLYWTLIDPTDENGQMYDRGSSYRPVIFVTSLEQRQIAEASKTALSASGLYDKPIVVSIEDAQIFWPAEDYHQDFYKTHPKHYKAVHRARERFLARQRRVHKLKQFVTKK